MNYQHFLFTLNIIIDIFSCYKIFDLITFIIGKTNLTVQFYPNASSHKNP